MCKLKFLSRKNSLILSKVISVKFYIFIFYLKDFLSFLILILFISFNKL